MEGREPAAQRADGADAPPPLSVRSAASNAATNEPPPRTPTNKIKAERASKQTHRAPRETEMEDNARGTAEENTRDERISHDLSLTDNSRHSIMDNMLMSLNPDQLKSLSPPTGPPPFSASSESISQTKSAPRRLHSGSFNSDFDFPLDDSPNRHSVPLPRSRRSHSSSAFQSGLGRIDSVHGDGDADKTAREEVSNTQQAGGVDSASVGARKSNKSSGSSSVDLGKMGRQARYPHATLGRRSASFDQGERIRIIHTASSSTTQPPPPLPTSRSRPIIYDDFNAAPTPTVPGGPRKDRAPVYPPQAPPPQAPTHQRRNSKASSRSQPVKKKKGDTVGWDAPMPSNSNAYAASRRTSKQVSPMPMFIKSRHPSPVRQYSEPLMAQRLDSTAQSTIHSKDVTKERHGFFRRMFGSSRDTAPATNDPQAPHFPPARGHTRLNSREGYATPHKLSKPAVPEECLYAPSENVHPPLGKKGSSFFRRRKKSSSEEMPLPTLPLNVKSHRPPLSDPIEQSPVSSLRQVMNPFLDDPMRSNAQQFAGTTGGNYAPPHTHTLQAKGSAEPINQDYDLADDAGFNNPLSKVRDMSTSTSRREALAERIHLTPEDRSLSQFQDNSFLHDDSSNDTKISGSANDTQLARQNTVSLDLPPTSFPSSLSSRKDNGRPRSKPKDSAESLSQRSVDSPRNRNVLSTRNNNLPTLQRAADAIPTKSKPRDWLTPSQLTTSKKRSSPPGSSNTPSRSQRLWLQPDSPEPKLRTLDVSIPADGAEISPISDYHSASSVQSASRPNDDIHFPEPTPEDATHKLSAEIDPNQPTEADRVQAKQIYDGDESLASKPMAAAWLGEPGPERMRVRQAYVELFNWQNLNILAALRGLCSKLYLKGEAQQVDRILDAFSHRWCACNPSHGFKATGMSDGQSSMA